MRNAEIIMGDMNGHIEITARLNLEVFLDMRDLLSDIKSKVEKIKDDVQAIKVKMEA